MNPFRLPARLYPAPRAPVRLGAWHARQDPSKRPGGGLPALDPPAPVPVPWRITHRSPSGVIEVEHVGGAPLHSVRFSLAGSGMLGLSLPRTVHPGERLRVTLRGTHSEGVLVAPDAMLVLRWFQEDGTELLWPIAP